MSLIVFDSYTEIGRGLVAKTELESAGFHPVFENYHYASILSYEMLALGGLILKVPNHEYEDARAFMDAPTVDAPLDYDPLPERRFGKWVAPTTLGLFGFQVAPVLPFLFIPVRILVLIMVALIGYFFLRLPQHWLTTSIWALFAGGFIAIVAHAEYIAGPKILKGNAHVDKW